MSTELLDTVDNGQSPNGHSHRSLDLFDSLGIFASSLCMVHCLALPFIMASLPFTMAWLGHDNMHYLLAGWVLLFCLAAIVPGYLKHRHVGVLLAMLVGLSLVLTATFGLRLGIGLGLTESMEIPMITVGNLLVIAAHWRNRHLNHAHIKCHH